MFSLHLGWQANLTIKSWRPEWSKNRNYRESESYEARGVAFIAAFAGRDASRNVERKPLAGRA
jgi:hypothetical protein